jgi:hypothetical protein
MKVGVIKSYFGNPQWAKLIKQKAGNAEVIFQDQFQDPSWYNYYTNSLKGVAYDSRFYRRTQFDIWPLEDSLQQKRVYFVTDNFADEISTDSVNTPKDEFYGGWLNQTRTYQKIQVEAGVTELNVTAGKTIPLNLKITNPYSKTVDFTNAEQLHPVVLSAFIMQENTQISEQSASSDFNQLKLKPGETRLFPFQLKTPLQKGKYTLLFSVRTTPFSGPRSSKIINLNIQ